MPHHPWKVQKSSLLFRQIAGGILGTKKNKNNECKTIENVIIFEEKYMNKYIDNFMESIEILISQ